MTTTNLGIRIREARKSSRFPRQADLAKEVGCTREHIARIETGVGNPSLVTLVKIADALEIRMSALVDNLRVR